MASLAFSSSVCRRVSAASGDQRTRRCLPQCLWRVRNSGLGRWPRARSGRSSPSCDYGTADGRRRLARDVPAFTCQHGARRNGSRQLRPRRGDGRPIPARRTQALAARPAPVDGASSGLGVPFHARMWEPSTAAWEKRGQTNCPVTTAPCSATPQNWPTTWRHTEPGHNSRTAPRPLFRVRTGPLTDIHRLDLDVGPAPRRPGRTPPATGSASSMWPAGSSTKAPPCSSTTSPVLPVWGWPRPTGTSRRPRR